MLLGMDGGCRGGGGGCFSVGISGGNSFSLGGGGGEWICHFISLDLIFFLFFSFFDQRQKFWVSYCQMRGVFFLTKFVNLNMTFLVKNFKARKKKKEIFF